MSPPRTDGELFHVDDTLDGKTLPAAIRGWKAGLSWGAVKKLLDSRRITVNGNLTLDDGRRLKAGDVVKLLEVPAASPPKESDVKIRFLDAHLVVVEKPAGMTTLRHPEERDWPRRRKQLQPTLDEVLPGIVEKKAGGKDTRHKGPPRRLRAVHRLDRETSGLMVFARTVQAESALGLQFRAHSLQRQYIAVCRGNLFAKTFDTYLIPDRGDGRRGSTHYPNQGKRAITHVKPLERLGEYTVVQCRLETGRTHQIRIHLSEAGHPICGDKVYRGPFPGAPIADESRATRVALHAADLGFVHPITGEHLSFSMALPFDMLQLIDRLRGRPGRPPEVELMSIPQPILAKDDDAEGDDDTVEPEDDDEAPRGPRRRQRFAAEAPPSESAPRTARPSTRPSGRPSARPSGRPPRPGQSTGGKTFGGKSSTPRPKFGRPDGQAGTTSFAANDDQMMTIEEFESAQRRAARLRQTGGAGTSQAGARPAKPGPKSADARTAGPKSTGAKSTGSKSAGTKSSGPKSAGRSNRGGTSGGQSSAAKPQGGKPKGGQKFAAKRSAAKKSGQGPFKGPRRKK